MFSPQTFFIFEIINKHNVRKATLEIRDMDSIEYPTGTEVIILLPDEYNLMVQDELVKTPFPSSILKD